MPNLIRNRVTERDIRDWLQANGYEGGSATLESVELYAIKRPDWQQLLRFTGKVRPQSNDDDEIPPKVAVWGVALEDERESTGQQTRVILCDSLEEQQRHLEELSADMLKARRPEDRAVSGTALLAMIGFGLVLLFLIATIRQFYE